MKRTKHLLTALCLVAVGTAIASCGSDDGEENGTVSQSRIENYIYGKKWFLQRWSMDINENTTYSFYRNHLVMSFTGAGKLTSGMLTYDNTIYFGTWQVQGDNIITSFTTGTYPREDMNNILYGTLNVTGLDSKTDNITCTDPQGETRNLTHYETYGSKKRTFTDYTDESSHDRALQGTWHATAYINNQPVEYTITVGKNGTVRWQQPDHDIDFTSSYTTINGHVTVDHILVPDSKKVSYIYIREDDRVLFYGEQYAAQIWIWRK